MLDATGTRGRLVVLTGPDGCGKSTLIANLRPQLADWHFASADPRDLYPNPDLPHMDYALSHHPREWIWRAEPLTQAAFFAQTLASEVEYRIEPHLSDGRDVLSDSYVYRLIAKQRLLNSQGAALLEKLIPAVPKPHLLIVLQVPPEDALARKSHISRFETYRHRGADGFIDFQRQVSALVEAYAVGVPRLYVDATQPPMRVTREVHAALRAGIGAMPQCAE